MTVRSDSGIQCFTVQHDGVSIPVSRGGRGRPLVLCPGLNCTQADLYELVSLLRRDHDVATFDLRGHGLASPAERYSFDAFLDDLVAVMAELDLPSAPVVVGYSLGADLAVHYAAQCPETVAGLVLIDGANPLPEPFLADADFAEFRAVSEAEAARHGSLTAEDIFGLGIEMDVVRGEILDRYQKIDLPVHVIMSTAIAGDSAEGRAPRHNRLWRAGVERLIRDQPRISADWIDGDHGLVFTHAPDVAEIIRSRLASC
ncbi:alpha/beta fold hydrolase [Streptomyces cahuitamycinicus]|uniref:Alpha/beta hydrolase n=1 Tax=Streptomyces cahuitamycinicus TaxID=2070367 RepID=A0A2N8TGB7_9ACTN|nr:alpha/beta hydrolase [Streptomyces cahuitamycinicus]PNG18081.1 alpha/beta hydrolase [Streptomyces cahuitamycinicus]